MAQDAHGSSVLYSLGKRKGTSTFLDLISCLLTSLNSSAAHPLRLRATDLLYIYLPPRHSSRPCSLSSRGACILCECDWSRDCAGVHRSYSGQRGHGTASMAARVLIRATPQRSVHSNTLPPAPSPRFLSFRLASDCVCVAAITMRDELDAHTFAAACAHAFTGPS